MLSLGKQCPGGKKSYHILMNDLKSMKIGRDKYLIYSE
jgi:hypothetical protein